jgi:hypothetical protein
MQYQNTDTLFLEPLCLPQTQIGIFLSKIYLLKNADNLVCLFPSDPDQLNNQDYTNMFFTFLPSPITYSYFPNKLLAGKSLFQVLLSQENRSGKLL